MVLISPVGMAMAAGAMVLMDLCQLLSKQTAQCIYTYWLCDLRVSRAGMDMCVGRIRAIMVEKISGL